MPDKPKYHEWKPIDDEAKKHSISGALQEALDVAKRLQPAITDLGKRINAHFNNLR